MIIFIKRIKNKNACTLFVVGYNKVVLEIRINKTPTPAGGPNKTSRLKEKERRWKISAAGLASPPCSLSIVL